MCWAQPQSADWAPGNPAPSGNRPSTSASKSSSLNQSWFHAKSETVATSVIAESFRTRKCLVPANGFYEWRAEGKRKLPVHFRLKDRSLFAFAGIWDIWRGPAGAVFTCAILTTKRNELTATVQD